MIFLRFNHMITLGFIKRSCICLLFLAYLFHPLAEAEEYKGSHAYNQSQPFKASVNTATGTFSFSYPLINVQGYNRPQKINLTYQFNDTGMFSLPKGWRLDIDYVADKTAYLGGKQWLIDDLWHDETLFASGLKYYNQHGAAFDDMGIAKPIPERQDLTYRYHLYHKDGSRKYFSHQGLLVLEIDRFNNSIEYVYETPVRRLDDAKLNRIIDNYGNAYCFSYEPNALIITYPDGREQKIYVGPMGVKTIINPMGQRYDITYIKHIDEDLINSIQSPSGLLTELFYGSIPYKEGANDKELPVVTEFKQMDLKDHSLHHHIHYKYTKGKNYTGFPLYSLSKSGDSLIDSDNQNYRYAVEMFQMDGEPSGVQMHQKIYEYNFLHLPVEVRTLNQGLPYLKTEYKYDINPFKSNRSTNYDKPTEVVNTIWDDSNRQWLFSDKVTHLYDNFGNKLMTRHYVYHRDKREWLLTHSTYKEYYTDSYSLLSKKTQKDHLSGRAIETRYQLAKDKKTHKQIDIFSRAGRGANAWKPWKKVAMHYDSHGRKIEESMMWAATGQPGVQRVNKKTNYLFESETALLTTKYISHEGRVRSIILDTRNGNKVSSITPKGEVTSYEYNPLGQRIRETDAAGNIIESDYLTFEHEGINAVVHKSPLGDTRRLIKDASGRDVASQVWHKGQYRNLYKKAFNGFGKLVAQTDRSGNTTQHFYDEQKRLIWSVDPWSNKTEIIYDDLSLKTIILLNGMGHKIVRKIPWLRQTITRHLPFTADKNEKMSLALENTQTHDAFKKHIEEEVALVDAITGFRYDTVTTRMHYDSSQNMIESETFGFDGIHLDKSMKYDIFNNLSSFNKIMRTHEDKYTHSSYIYTYNADNLLVKSSSPLDSGSAHLVTQYEYDKNGKQIVKILPDGHRVLHEYDNRRLLVSSQWLRNDKPYKISHVYDADGRQIQSVDSDGQKLDYQYTQTGLIAQVYSTDNHSQSYEYDEFERLIAQKNADGSQLQYHYNQQDKGHISAIVSGNNKAVFSYGRDNNGINGQLLKLARDFSGTGETTAQYRYDAFGRIANTTIDNSILGATYDIIYRYNPKGELLFQLTNLTEREKKPNRHLVEYEYDSLSRVISEKREHTLGNLSPVNDVFSYRYDSNNNLIQEQHFTDTGKKITYDRSYNRLDQLVNIQSSESDQLLSIVYDTNGRLIIDHQGSVYHYDDANFLLKMEDSTGAHHQFAYWPNGLLSHYLGSSHQDYYYDQNKCVQSFYQNGSWQSFIRQGHNLMGSIESNHVNQVMRVNQSTGATVNLADSSLELSEYQYQAYGNPLGSGEPAQYSKSNPPFEFTWNQELNFLGLTYLRHRFYHPSLRQFLSPDTYKVDNRYAYAHGNPVMLIDPTGHNAQQGVGYGLGSGLTVLGILGAVFAAPTGGASLTLSAAAGIGGGVATSLSGVAMMGSQVALDSGNKEAAKALQITSVTLGALAMAELVVAVAPKFAGAIQGFSRFIASSRESGWFATKAFTLYRGSTQSAMLGFRSVETGSLGTVGASGFAEAAGYEIINATTELADSSLIETSVEIVPESVEEASGSRLAVARAERPLVMVINKAQETWISRFKLELALNGDVSDPAELIASMQPETVFRKDEIYYLSWYEQSFEPEVEDGSRITDAFREYADQL